MDAVKVLAVNAVIGVGISFVLALVLTVSVLLEHYVLTWLVKIGLFKSVGNVENPELTFTDVFWFIVNTTITWFPTCTHAYSVVLNREFYVSTGLFTLPSLPQLFAYSISTLFMHDTWHYFVHRMFHAVNAPAWLKKIHQEHHLRVVHSKGMLCTDLMAVHPTEYWATIMPAYSFCFEFFHVLPKANFVGWMVSQWIAVLIAELGHSNIDIPMPGIKYLGFSKVSDHAMHHHDARYNFAIYTTVLDRLFGTYKPYTQCLSRAASRANSRGVSRQSSFRQLKGQRSPLKGINWDRLLGGNAAVKQDDVPEVDGDIKAVQDPSHSKHE